MNITELSPWLILILVGVLPTEIWRVIGVFASTNVKEGSELFIWVKGVATATLAAVVAKLAFFPAGALANVPFSVRLAALVIGICAFYISKKRIFIGVFAGEIALILGIRFF